MTEVVTIHVPLFEELSVKNLYPKIIVDLDIAKYLPDKKEGEYPERSYFFDVLGTRKQQFLRDCVQHALTIRNYNEGSSGELMKVSNTFMDELSKHNFHSSKSTKK